MVLVLTCSLPWPFWPWDLPVFTSIHQNCPPTSVPSSSPSPAPIIPWEKSWYTLANWCHPKLQCSTSGGPQHPVIILTLPLVSATVSILHDLPGGSSYTPTCRHTGFLDPVISPSVLPWVICPCHQSCLPPFLTHSTDSPVHGHAVYWPQRLLSAGPLLVSFISSSCFPGFLPGAWEDSRSVHVFPFDSQELQLSLASFSQQSFLKE